MAIFYHLDRGKTLSEGQIVELIKHHDISVLGNQPNSRLQQHFTRLFPNGVTHHGNRYFACALGFMFTEPSLELLFEYVRRANYPDKPSRAESFFAVDSIKDVNRLAEVLKVDVNDYCVWEVECDKFHRANMRLLAQGTNLVTSYWASEYWEGSSGVDEEPLWEYLLVPPVKVVKKITYYI